MKFENTNGNTYYIDVYYQDVENGLVVAILKNYGRKTETEIQAGAAPVQYILATFYDMRDWEKRAGSWSYGNYYPGTFEGLEKAKANMAEKIF